MYSHVLLDDEYIVVYIVLNVFVFYFKQKTAYEMRISDWSSDVCSSDLEASQPYSSCAFAYRSKFDLQLRRCNRRHHAFHARYRAGRRNLDEQCWRTLATDWHRSRRHDDDDPRVIGRSMLRRSLRTDFGLHSQSRP